ncbi:SgcJ/EcaC family oxidoreductase [Dinghuibacter silviterrae]|uniref:Uncharacterized protein (TIGR02246 family) n=1 Tax=Dinghuibacter silviterrae TaxID=1539049 RepID=A0A4R8DVT5_9BACT|nr:SgcJ/EcaC family oxidoreductase [Dinghuibacter silviterrae]TDX02166.1 uncharacterized protein (TIGR02246 family) [Dinghuibacter silviterrae]
MTIKTNTLTVFTLVTFALLWSRPSFGQGSKDEQAVKNVVASFQDDFNDGRYLKVDSYTTQDWVHINPIGGITYGRDSVLKELLPLQSTILKGAAMTTESTAVRFLSPTVAMALVVHQVGDYEFPQGVKHHNERYMKTYILVKKQNKWLLTLDQNDVIVPQ